MAQSSSPDEIWKPFGAFSQIVVGGDGQLVHLKGQVSLDKNGVIVGAADMSAQVNQVLCNIKALLEVMNGRMSDVTTLHQFTTDIEAFMTTGHIRQIFFQRPYPVTTTVEVKSLYDPQLLIEITATAEIPNSRFVRPTDALVMHR